MERERERASHLVEIGAERAQLCDRLLPEGLVLPGHRFGQGAAHGVQEELAAGVPAVVHGSGLLQVGVAVGREDRMGWGDLVDARDGRHVFLSVGA
ncbi:hypothetical protein AS594_33855 [Streptomyces agglomeratus]|uniref:Uncharacterized protein n=1 Tax=Streptomyces agglomeratus TaxID=285458 RepID=A0A1E5PGQ7_9ACTN|nr:hypothetical protein AS594_33855 [Streptomyces agglomeratus]